jgi:hypothetical protein
VSELLRYAFEVHHGGHPTLGPSATRAVAMLARRALEDAVEAELGLPPDTRTPFAVQLTALEVRRGPDLARRVSLVWSALSRMCHYHGYELAPTHNEVDGWLGEVQRLVATLARTPPP